MQYEPEESELLVNYKKLLEALIDGRIQQRVHPSFPSILRQLSPADAYTLQVLKYLSENPPAEERRGPRMGNRVFILGDLVEMRNEAEFRAIVESPSEVPGRVYGIWLPHRDQGRNWESAGAIERVSLRSGITTNVLRECVLNLKRLGLLTTHEDDVAAASEVLRTRVLAPASEPIAMFSALYPASLTGFAWRFLETCVPVGSFDLEMLWEKESRRPPDTVKESRDEKNQRCGD